MKRGRRIILLPSLAFSRLWLDKECALLYCVQRDE